MIGTRSGTVDEDKSLISQDHNSTIQMEHYKSDLHAKSLNPNENSINTKHIISNFESNIENGIKQNLPESNKTGPISVNGKEKGHESTITLLSGGQISPAQKNAYVGIVQIVISLLLAGLGGLLIGRGASLAILCAGFWAGLLAGTAGILGIIRMKRIENSLLAVSLICIATASLAIAITGIGLMRDFNLSAQDETKKAAINGAIWILVPLGLHLILSMYTVYNVIMTKYNRSSTEGKVSPGLGNDGYVGQPKVCKHINSISVIPYDMVRPQFVRRPSLIPALMMPTPMPPQHYHYPPMMYPNQTPSIYSVPVSMYSGLPPPYYVPTTSAIERQRKMSAHNQMSEHYYASLQSEKRHRRRKSDSAIVNGKMLVESYTGLDRTIADDYLAMKERALQHNGGVQ